MTFQRRTSLALALALAIALVACARQSPEAADAAPADMAVSETSAAGSAAPSAPPAPPMQVADGAASRVAEKTDGPGVDADAMGSAAMTQTTGTRRFIRTAQIECQVADVQRSAVRIEDLAARYGGFVTRNDVAAEVRRVAQRPIGNGRLVELSTYVTRGDLQLRVPSDRAQPFLRAIAAEMEFLDRRRFEAVDAQFDLLRRELARRRHDQAQAALGAAAAQGGKLIDKADVIAGRVDQQTARDEAIVEQRTFEDRVEFATLDLAMRQPERVRRAERPDVDAILRDEGPGFFARAGDALAGGWRASKEVGLFVLAAWPLWLILGVVIALVRALRRRRVRA